MSLRIDQDHARFRAIVRGKIRQNLRKYISQGELIGRKGKDVVSIPIPQIDIPRFRYGDKQGGGVGQGDGDEGDPMGGGQEQEGEGGKKAGKDAGEHALEVDVTLDELAEILGEELALPNIENKGKSKLINAEGPLRRHPQASDPTRSATSSAPTARRSSARSRRAPTTRANPIDRPHPRRPPVPLVEDGRRSRSPTRSSST